MVALGALATTPAALSKTLAAFGGGRVVLEAGSQSPWMSRRLRSEGFDVHVADPRRVQLISKDPRKTDRRDAAKLSEQVRLRLTCSDTPKTQSTINPCPAYWRHRLSGRA